jgi:1-pyrroline-4-hydroxy-2-carboxylate deaminase
MDRKPWHGVLVATALPWKEDDTPDFEAYATHIAWLATHGCDGATPNGSLGEYQVLTDSQRDTVVRTAVQAAPDGFVVMPGIGAYGAKQARRHAEVAAAAGCPAVMLLPPNSYRARPVDVIEHYRIVAEVGIPIVAYNNPFDTKVDLVPELLSQLYHEGLIVAVKEFSGDVRRFYELRELVPDLDVLAGSDDVVLELALTGSPGWIAGYPNVFPASCVELFTAARARDLDKALPLYAALHSLLRWDSKTEFVQAIKLSMDLNPDAIDGGRCQPPRGPLSDADAASIREATEKALAAGLR